MTKERCSLSLRSLHFVAAAKAAVASNIQNFSGAAVGKVRHKSARFQSHFNEKIQCFIIILNLPGLDRITRIREIVEMNKIVHKSDQLRVWVISVQSAQF